MKKLFMKGKSDISVLLVELNLHQNKLLRKTVLKPQHKIVDLFSILETHQIDILQSELELLAARFPIE